MTDPNTNEALNPAALVSSLARSGYGVATICSLVTFIVVLASRQFHFPQAATAVIVALVTTTGAAMAGWYGGSTPGWCAVGISAVLIVILMPKGSLIVSSYVYLLILCAISGGMSWFANFVHRRLARLAVENDWLRMILDRAPVGIVLYGHKRTVLYSNPAFRRTYGLSDEEAKGLSIPVPDDQKPKWDQLEEILNSGRSFLNEEAVRNRKDGSRFYARISGSPVVDNTGRRAALVGVIAAEKDDHSERRELRRLQFLVQGTPDFMCIADLNQKTLFVNDSGKEMVGIEEDESGEGTALLNYFAEEDRTRVANAVQTLRLQNVGLLGSVQMKHLKTGVKIPAACSIHLVNDPLTGEPESIACVAQGRAERKKAEDELDQSKLAFQTFLQNAPLGIVLVDLTGVPIDSNLQFQRMLGYTADEVKQTPFSKFVHPEDLPQGRALFLDLASGKINRYQVRKRLVDRQGETFWTNMTVTLVRNLEREPLHSISMVQRLPEQAKGTANPAGLSNKSEADDDDITRLTIRIR